MTALRELAVEEARHLFKNIGPNQMDVREVR